MCVPIISHFPIGNAASSTSEIWRLAFCVVCLDSLNVDPARAPPSRTETLCSSLSSLIGWNPLMKVVGALSSYQWHVKSRSYHFYPDVSQTVCVRRVIYCVRVVSTIGFGHLWTAVGTSYLRYFSFSVSDGLCRASQVSERVASLVKPLEMSSLTHCIQIV